MIGYEYESARVHEIDGELLVPISAKLMPPLRRGRRHQCQGASRFQDGETIHDHPGHPRSVRFLERVGRIEGSLELAGPESNVHVCTRYCYSIGNSLHGNCKGGKGKVLKPRLGKHGRASACRRRSPRTRGGSSRCSWCLRGILHHRRHRHTRPVLHCSHRRGLGSRASNARNASQSPREPDTGISWGWVAPHLPYRRFRRLWRSQGAPRADQVVTSPSSAASMLAETSAVACLTGSAAR